MVDGETCAACGILRSECDEPWHGEVCDTCWRLYPALRRFRSREMIHAWRWCRWGGGAAARGQAIRMWLRLVQEAHGDLPDEEVEKAGEMFGVTRKWMGMYAAEVKREREAHCMAA